MHAGKQLPVKARLWQLCPLISSAAWVRRAEHEGFLAFCSAELAELIRVTATSASAQKKGQWLRLDAQLFSRQLENNTVTAHSIHAAGTEALLKGSVGKVSGGGLHSAGLLLHLNRPFPMLHCEGMPPFVTAHCFCVTCLRHNAALGQCAH